MQGLLVSFGHWLQNRDYALAVAGSDWAYPWVQALHFAGLSLWIGTNIAVDLSLLGVGNKDQSSPAKLSDTLFAWNWLGFLIAITGGFLLFSASAETYVINPAFLTKLGFLIPVGLILHIVIQRKIHGWCDASEYPSAAKLAGGVELGLWLCVAMAAVLIPYAA